MRNVDLAGVEEISIPYGAIKSLSSLTKLRPQLAISIPYGAIKRIF